MMQDQNSLCALADSFWQCVLRARAHRASPPATATQANLCVPSMTASSASPLVTAM